MAKSKYETHVLPHLDKIAEWAKQGISGKAIAKSLHVSYSSFKSYLAEAEKGNERYSDLLEAYTRACEEPDKEVETALYRLACGYNATVLKHVKRKVVIIRNGQRVEEREEIVPVYDEVHIPANVMAQEFWLTNRKPGTWKYKPEAEAEENEDATGVVELPPVMDPEKPPELPKKEAADA